MSEQTTQIPDVDNGQTQRKPTRANALDLICQHELTPDFTLELRSSGGQWKLAKFALRYLLAHWHRALLVILVGIVAGLLDALAPWPQAVIINYAVPEQNWVIFFVAVIIYWNLRIVFWPGFVYWVPSVIGGVMEWYLQNMIRSEARIAFFRHLHRLSLRFFERRPQVHQKIAFDAAVFVEPVRTIFEAVPLAGVQHRVEVAALVDQGLDQADGVLGEDVFVHHPVQDE